MSTALSTVTAFPKPITMAKYLAERLNIQNVPEKADTKAVVALAEAQGHSKDVIKAIRKDHKAVKDKHYVDSALTIAVFAADQRIRKSLREVVNKKTGKRIGFNATFREEKSKGVGMSARIAQLEKLLADANAKLAGLPSAS